MMIQTNNYYYEKIRIVLSSFSSSFFYFTSALTRIISKITTFNTSIFLLFLSSFLLLIFTQTLHSGHYANAIETGLGTTIPSSDNNNPSPLGQSIQENQQNLQNSIQNQVQNTFSNTIKNINKDNNNIISNNNNISIIKNTIFSQNIQNNILITNILATNLENHFKNAGAVINIISELPQMRNLPSAFLLNQTLNKLHGILQNEDIEKRQVAKDILSNYKDFQIIIFMMPNGDIYFEEPYSRQQNSTTSNLAFRDYFKGVINSNEMFIGDPSISISSNKIQSVIATPVFSLKNKSTIIGLLAGGMDFNVLNKELQSIKFSSVDYKRVVYVGHNGQKIADSDTIKSNISESFANLKSFKNAINGQSGWTIDTINNSKMVVTYHPVKLLQNTFVVLLMQEDNSNTR